MNVIFKQSFNSLFSVVIRVREDRKLTLRLSLSLSSCSKRGVVVTGGSFFSRGSRFRYQGRCEREVVLDSTGILREAPRVRRTPHLMPRSTSLPTTPPGGRHPHDEDEDGTWGPAVGVVHLLGRDTPARTWCTCWDVVHVLGRGARAGRLK